MGHQNWYFLGKGGREKVEGKVTEVRFSLWMNKWVLFVFQGRDMIKNIENKDDNFHK